MEILGKVQGCEVVLNKDDGARALKMVDALPAAPGDGDSHAVQLRINVGEHKRGDIFVYMNDTWTKVVVPTETVGSVNNIICPRINQDVQIRWNDPEDRAPYTWKHTRLLRKYGEYPQNIFDGVIVTDSYIRNQYDKLMYHDYVPAGTENGWHYRFFTFSEDEVPFSDDSCLFRPIELTWKNMNQLVQSGLIYKVFALGDAITITPKKAYETHPFYKSLTFAVAGFDQATPEDMTKNKSITFTLVDTFGDFFTNWDSCWPEYKLTTDIYVTDRTKVYYIKDTEKGWVEVTNLPLGKKLEANTYYEKNTNVERKSHGGNRWASSAFRAWLNSTDVTNTWKFYDGTTEISVPPPLTVLEDDVVNAITPMRNRNALPLGEDRASSDYEMSIDKLYLLSMTEVHNEHAVYSWFQPTSDTIPKNYGVTEDTERNLKKNYFIYMEDLRVYRKADASDFNEDGSFKTGVTYNELYYYLYNEISGEYRLALADDYTEANEFKSGVQYYDKKVSDIAENNYLPYFDDELLNPRVVRNSGGTPQTWWLRSGNIFSTTKVRYTDTNGKLCEGDQAFEGRHAIVFGFSVA